MSNSQCRIVIVGIGEIKDRPAHLSEALDPVGLIAEATRRALADAGPGERLRGQIDSVDVMHLTSWRYDNTARTVTRRLCIQPERALYHPAGGERATRAIHDAALRLADGEGRVALVCGAEAMSSSKKARAASVDLAWPARAKQMEHPLTLDQRVNRLSVAHDIVIPVHVYPLYENACVAAWRQRPAEGMAESADLWGRYAAIAAANPFAWTQTSVPIEAIATPSSENRPIAYPYLRLMVANPTVNLGAAILLMREDDALAAGIAPERLVFLTGGAAADEPADYLLRDNFTHAAAQEAVLASTRDLVEGVPYSHLELYSCFPIVPKMARRNLGLTSDFVPSVAGGLTFFGAPMSNYMGHATCAMVRQLRDGGGTGLLYGQGDLVTKHHALVLQTRRPDKGLATNYDLSVDAAKRRGPAPIVTDEASGEARIETFTIVYDKAGLPDRCVVIARTPAGARTMARVAVGDQSAIERLTSADVSPVGAAGQLAMCGDGLLEWSFHD